jgi:hypothetical protein
VEDNPWFSPIAQWAEPSRFATELRCPLSFTGYVHSKIAVDECGFSSVSFPPPSLRSCPFSLLKGMCWRRREVACAHDFVFHL